MLLLLKLAPYRPRASQQLEWAARAAPPVSTNAPAMAASAASMAGGRAAVSIGPDGGGFGPPGGSVTCGCGDRAPTVVIGVLTEDNAAGAERRQVIRQTWAALVEPCDAVVRFLLSIKPGTRVPAPLLAENKVHHDLLLLPVDPGTRRGYHGSEPSNLLVRVQHYFKWATGACPHTTYFMKSDDDCYVAADRLVSRIRRGDFEGERLFFGRFLGGMSAMDRNGKPDKDNYMKLDKFPKYAGAGYVLTADVARFVGDPGLPFNFHRVEDRGIGVLLNGFNITSVRSCR